jgi:hypothetical protein
MTERSGMSRRQVLKYGGLAAAVPLLPALRPAKEADPSGGSSLPRQVTPAQLSLADVEEYVFFSRVGPRGTRYSRCQLQVPSIRDRVDLDGDS